MDQDDIINRYDFTYEGYDELYGEEQKNKYDLLFSKIKPYGIVADIGCGTGLLMEYFYDTGLIDKINKYICLDLSINMLSLSNKRANKFCKDKCLVLWGNAEYLPFKNKSIDFLFSFSVINLLDNPENALNEFKRVSNNIFVSYVKKLKQVNMQGEIIGEDYKDLIFKLY
ncbi:methylase involved in ubiquinone/menaquinone biosynthesis [Caldisphaera lagunensis DSM 15908]|uniref:Methylase involved in ubiquinone/menaquinone biosynthesis n=1 Tax=Caldisphaera lagunensis (strain DSM 15908 / JCM 11604 / ANMR 0165 / IC-154) TaxID=1056495 RepID=L0A843_CALLD|nr:class I SAM-dependent methyltransferase [Caldisphaera lagunensis]AFZ70001.1 methylase involved in ubiquinone/menaquinone biosynthesis [Caldisphaera lagunensis DSM 15908]